MRTTLTLAPLLFNAPSIFRIHLFIELFCGRVPGVNVEMKFAMIAL